MLTRIAATSSHGMLARLVALLRSAAALVVERSAASAVIQNLAVRVALIGVTFGTGIIVARALAPVGRGEQAALGLWPILLSGLATFGMPLALMYQTRKHPHDAGRLFFAASVVAACAGVVVSVIGACAMPLFLRGYSASLIQSARWLMLFAPQILVLYVVRAHLEANGEFTRSILGQLVPMFFTLLTLIGLRLTGNLSPATAVLAYYIPTAVLTCWLLWKLRSRFVVRILEFRNDVTTLLSYGFRSYGTDLINALSTQIDLAVIVAFLNPLALGLYSVALTLSRLLLVVNQSLITVLFPNASGRDAEGALDLVARAARISTAVSVVLGLGLIVVLPTALPLVYGAAFAAALSIVPILTAEAILSGLANVLGLSFLATGRPTVVTLIQVGWIVTAIGMLVILVPRMQLVGAAVALLAASFMRIVFIAVAYRLVLHRMLPRLIAKRSDFTEMLQRFHNRSVKSEIVPAA